MQNVKIVKGILSSGEIIENITLQCEKIVQAKGPFNTTYYASFDTRQVAGIKQRINLRIMFLGASDFEILDGGQPTSYKENYKKTLVNQAVDTYVQEEVIKKTDEELTAEITDKFFVLDLISKAVAENNIRSLIVSGTPGTGKSFGVEKIMEEHSKKNGTFYYTIIKGAITPIMLFSTLWECRSKNSVLILDDCDSAFDDVETLNLLKAASDSSRTRKICYNKLSSHLADNDIPNSFEFEGSLVILSNINFASELQRKTKYSPHISALVSRSHFIDVNLNSNREKMIRLMLVARSEMFAKEHKVKPKQIEECCDWVKENQDKIRELSLRSLSKLIDLQKSFPDQWAKIAKITLCN